MESQRRCEEGRDCAAGRALRVLVVDDDVDTATSTALVLQIYGYEVEVATAGLMALQIAQATQPDVVLLDLALPGMDGWQVAAQLRQQRTAKKRPLVIAITGYGEPAARLRSYEAGIDLHLVKPVRIDELQHILTRVQTVAMRSAERVVADRPKSRSRACLLKDLSDRARAHQIARRVTAIAGGREELAIRIETFQTQVHVHLAASKAHCRRIASYLTRVCRHGTPRVPS